MAIAIDPNKRSFSFKCAGCGEVHEGGPSFGYDAPPEYYNVPETERETRSRINSDLCIIDNEDFFIRATLSVPIIGAEEDFLWGVWVSQSKESFDRYVDTYESDQSGDGSFGWLTVSMPGYAEDIFVHLPVDVFWGPERPEIKIHDDQDHPLAVDQRNGISWDKAVELAVTVMHPPQD
jgi:hypothetical protein